MDHPHVTTLNSTIHAAWRGVSLIDYLCRRFTYRDRSAWLEAIAAGQVRVNGAPTAPERALEQGSTVSYAVERREPAVATDIAALFEDEHVLVVNKPAPLPVHSDRVFIEKTLIAILRRRTGNADLTLGHRLDRETTGIVVLAKSRGITGRLMAALEADDARKIYLAVARGDVGFAERTVRGWMGPKPGPLCHVRQHVVDHPDEGTKESATCFTLRRRLGGYSLLACELLTGRTHQIRAHLESIGHPVVGDKLYGRSDDEFLRYQTYVRETLDLSGGVAFDHPRQLLHAWQLSLRHPLTGQPMSWEAPVPADMEEFMRSRAGSEGDLPG